MDLLDRYLAAVGRDLPDAQRADVTAELRDELLSMGEEAESRRGRPQTEAEVEAMLIAFGHPLQVAGRFRRTQHLIGPEVFPFWWAWMRASLAIVAGIYVSLAVVSVLGGEAAEAVTDRATPSLSFALIFTFGVVTLIAAGVERWGKPALRARWKPQELPPLHGKTPTRFEMTIELAMSLVFLAWWVGLIHFRDWLPVYPIGLELAPVWAAWFWPILGYSVFEATTNLAALIWPGRVRLYRKLSIVRSLAGAAILGGVLRSGHFVAVSATWDLPPVVQTNFDRGFAIGIGVTILVFLGRAAIDAWRLRQFVQTAAALGRPAV